ncbi:MAG: PadR family transcriptional regulator [Actinomycetota bacterium]|nr:PadR family transcriptional regulator [Actinomycetota bacterium]
MTGWDLVATAEERIGDFWSLTRSQVYRELTAMAEAGLIAAGDRGPRERRPYSLTPAGAAAFQRWARRDPAPETIRFPLLLMIGFGRHVPPEVLVRNVRAHRAVHAARLASYERACEDGAGIDVHGRATLDFGLHYERAVLAWFDALPEPVRGPDPWPDVDAPPGQ